MKLIAQLGTITPPANIPTVGGNPSSFVASLLKGVISFLLVISFVAAFVWILLAGLRYITAGGDPKSTSQASSQLYWGFIGLVVVIGSFAIIKIMEAFFGVTIISGGFQLPTR